MTRLLPWENERTRLLGSALCADSAGNWNVAEGSVAFQGAWRANEVGIGVFCGVTDLGGRNAVLDMVVRPRSPLGMQHEGWLVGHMWSAEAGGAPGWMMQP